MSRKSDKAKPQAGGKPGADHSPPSSSTPRTDTTEITSDDMHAAKSVARQISGASGPLATPNFRRSHQTGRLFAVAVLVSLTSSTAVFFWMKSWVEKRLSGAPAHAVPSPAAITNNPASTSTAQIDSQIASLQKQLDAWRRDQLQNQQELRESIERVAAATSATPPQQLLPMNTSRPRPQAGVESVAEMSIQVTPTQKEFIQLKERNRLTAYADEVIATGSRKPLETLVEYMRNPESANLHEAATAEYLRAVRAIQTLQREDPGYRLPVAELFKDSNVRNEADLKPDALFKLLDDVNLPWEARVRAAILLKSSDAKETNEKLIRVIKEDPSLDVAKHAQITLEQRIGRRFRMFDIPAIEAWWKAQNR